MTNFWKRWSWIYTLFWIDNISLIFSPNVCLISHVCKPDGKKYSSRCKSNYKVYVYIVKRNYVLGGMLFTIHKAQLHVSALNVGRLQVVQWKLISQIYMHL
jgi:hypothetical protein